MQSIGDLYMNGQGLPKSPLEALKWYREAADEGYAPAMVNLGTF